MRSILNTILIVCWLIPAMGTWQFLAAAPAPPPVLDLKKPETWEHEIAANKAKLHEVTTELIAFARNDRHATADRQKAVQLLRKIASKESIAFLIANICMKAPQIDEKGRPSEKASLLCVDALLSFPKKDWGIARTLLDWLDKPRTDEELQHVTTVLVHLLGENLTRAIIERQLAKPPPDDRKYNLEIMKKNFPAQKSSGRLPSADWKINDMWAIAVTTYAPVTPATTDSSDEARIKERFSLIVLIHGEDTVERVPCWRIQFHPNPGAPARIGTRYTVFVDKRTGQPLRAERFQEKVECSLEHFPDLALFKGAPVGYPIDILPLTQNREFQRDKASLVLSLTSHTDGKDLLTEARFQAEGKEQLRIQQRWAEGAGWWREYKRFVKGRLDLLATMEKKIQRPPRPEPKPKPDPYSYQRDPRLQSSISFVADQSAVSDILKVLQSTTGVVLSAHPQLENHHPQFGSVNWPMRAWQVMEILAATQLQKGEWKEAGQGYQLTGTSTAPPLARVSTAPIVPPSRTWLTVSLVVSAVVLLGVGLGVIVYRRRSRMRLSAE